MTGVRHSTATMARARELKAAGWSNRKITDLIKSEGTYVTITTVRRWVDPAYAASSNARILRNQRVKTRAATEGRIFTNVKSPEALMARARALRQRGLSYDAVCAVIALDFPWASVSGNTLKRALQNDDPPLAWKARAA